MSGLNPDAFAKDGIRSDPSIDFATVVADLKSLSRDGFDQVQVLVSSHFAKDDVTDGKFILLRNGFDSAKLSRFDLAFHGMSTRTKTDCLAIVEFRDVWCSPSHLSCDVCATLKFAKKGCPRLYRLKKEVGSTTIVALV